jgi:hypothetical protein
MPLEPVLVPADFAVANFPDSPERGQHFPLRPLNVQDKGSIPRQLLLNAKVFKRNSFMDTISSDR